MSTSSPGAAAEWRAHWPIALAALCGYSMIGLQSYAIGPFVPSIEQEFGWTRAQLMFGVSVSFLGGVFLNIIVGLIVDRFGSRRVALTGLIVKSGAFALLATATGTLLNWTMLWALVAVGVVLVQSTVWMRALAQYFDKSRGFAFAFALSGTSLMSIVLPPYATWLILTYGWRFAMVAVAATWLAVALPVVFFLFHERRGPAARTEPAAEQNEQTEERAAPLPGLTFREGLRTRPFWLLFVSFGCFSFFTPSITTNLVPLLSETGVSMMQAAGIASIMGVVGVVVRLSVGALLDHLPGNLLGAATLFLPVIGAGLLLTDAPSGLVLSLAVACFGAAIGAEMDVALFLATRHFGLRAFASLFNTVIAFGALMAAIGPTVAGRLHDLTGNYDLLLMTIMVLMTIGSLAMLFIGPTPRAVPSGH